MAVEKEVLSIESASKLYDIKPARLRTMCILKKIPATKVGRMWFVSVATLEKLFKGGDYGSG